MKQFALGTVILFLSAVAHAQATKEVPPASLPATYKWWNLLHYSISIQPDYTNKFLRGTNEIKFSSITAGRSLVLLLQDPMRIVSVTWKGQSLEFAKEGDARYTISFPHLIEAGGEETIRVVFEGKPTVAKDPPVDNGWIWTVDQRNRPWMSVSCEGSGASIWLPCKEVLYDEPDEGVRFTITVPTALTAVANGRLVAKKKNKDHTTTFTWQVTSPINNYNIIPYIGYYKTWHRTYKGVKGNLDCDYWVLDYNLAKGKQHFLQADTMLRAFEYWMGPYPFYADSYKLVEAPMPGMEHQSAVAYGNGFQNGYRGKDFISRSGWGLKWDFMLVHESGHEWFGNSVTSSNYGDSWIHEGFTKYLEVLYTSFVYGIEAGNDYAIGTWYRIKNDEPILGNNTSDKYYKGGAMLHMIRQIVGDTVFRKMLTGLQHDFYHQTVATRQVLDKMNVYTGNNFDRIYQQYLETTQVPVFHYRFADGGVYYRWENCVRGFNMPLAFSIDNQVKWWVHPTEEWQHLPLRIQQPDQFRVDRNFYIQLKGE